MNVCILAEGHKATLCGKRNSWWARARGATYLTYQAVGILVEHFADMGGFRVCRNCMIVYGAADANSGR